MRRGDGKACIEYVHRYGRVTKTSIGGKAKSRLRLRPWQQKETYRILARTEDGRRKHRAGLLGVARKNGKSSWASGIAINAADVCDPGGEIYICAADREQARIVFGTASTMVNMDRYLSRRFNVYKNEIVVPSTETKIVVLSSEASTKDGYNPNLVVFDEVHAQTDDELWDAMALGMGARIDPLMLGITTAGKRYTRLGEDTLCYRLYEYGKQVSSGEVDDPSFYFAWWEPSEDDGENHADHLDERTWEEANPGIDDLVSREDLRSVAKRTDEPSFRTKRCNQWVSKATTAIPSEKWNDSSIVVPKPDGPMVTFQGNREVPAEWLADCVFFLDGSWSGDSTAIVGATRDKHLFVIANYEKRVVDTLEWRVPVASVMEDVRIAYRSGARLGLLDPYRWQQAASDLTDEGYPLIEWPTGVLARMIPAWKDFYTAVMTGGLTHDGDPSLARHVSNMVLKIDAKGARPTKENPNSKRHIDLGICAIGAFANHAVEPEGKRRSAWVL